MADTRETSLTIDHDAKMVYVDTTEKGFAKKLAGWGLKPLKGREQGANGNYRFFGPASLLKVAGRRRPSQAALAALKKARAARQIQS